MPGLNVVVRVEVPKQPGLAALEKATFRARQAAGRQLLIQAFALIEQSALEGAKQRGAGATCSPGSGEIRFSRWQTRIEGGYGYPLDRALEISPNAVSFDSDLLVTERRERGRVETAARGEIAHDKST